MRTYTVRAGDTPASIAARNDLAGCPKCARDLIPVNPHKEAVVYPNGFVTFKSLQEGETLNLPDKWFSKEFDERPSTYFAALPYPDGVTPSTLGDAAAGVLSDYSSLDAASAAVTALAQTADPVFAAAASSAAALIDSAVKEAASSTNPAAAGYAQDAKAGAYWAAQRSAGVANDPASVAQARNEIGNVLTTALGSARLALQTFYANPSPSAHFPVNVVSAAQAVAAAIASDPNYCASVAQVGSATNAAIHAFKTAWNAAQTPAVPINTGNYEQATADALARVIGTAPSACGARVTPATPSSSPQDVAVRAPEKKGLSTGEVFGVGLAGAVLVGGIYYLSTRPRQTHENARPFYYQP